MILKKKLIRLLLSASFVMISWYVFQLYTGAVVWYDQYFFYPFQSARMFIAGIVPVSIGDVLYVAGGAWLFITILKWGYYGFSFRTKKAQLLQSIITTVQAAVYVYILFLWGWGANYYKEPLGKSWGLYMTRDKDINIQRRNDSLLLVSFDSFLVAKLNTYAPFYQPQAFSEVNTKAKEYYRSYTDSKVSRYGAGLKPTLFNYFLELTGVEGYYNPFTGEGQVSSTLPAFIEPFVVCHEMAHQAGIAAEGDANLMAYVLTTMADDSSFKYSGYLDIWLYVDRKLSRRDSAVAATFARQLNKITQTHLDTLEEISKKYDNDVARYSSSLYDDYLKLQQQKDGLHSYGSMVSSAWQLEQRSKSRIIQIP